MYEVTYFKSVRFEDVRNPYIVNVLKVVKFIESERLKPIVEAIRKEKDKEKQASLKRQLPAVIFTGSFKSRYDKEIERHSGLIALDIDGKKENEILKDIDNARAILYADPYVFCAFLSPRMGLKLIIKIPRSIKKHRGFFRGLQEYFFKEYRVTLDSTSVNESRLCFLSYDPEIFLNQNSEVFTTFIPEPIIEKKKRGIKQVGKAINEEAEIIKRLLKWWERKFPFVEGQRNQNIFILASAFNNYGISKQTALEYCLQYQESDFKAKEIESCVKSAYSHSSQFNTKHFSL